MPKSVSSRLYVCFLSLPFLCWLSMQLVASSLSNFIFIPLILWFGFELVFPLRQWKKWNAEGITIQKTYIYEILNRHHICDATCLKAQTHTSLNNMKCTRFGHFLFSLLSYCVRVPTIAISKCITYTSVSFSIALISVFVQLCALVTHNYKNRNHNHKIDAGLLIKSLLLA